MVVIITGASGSIGSYLCEQMAHKYSIIATYHTHEPTISKENIDWFQVDVTRVSSIKRFLDTIATRLDQVVLINLAGISLDGMAHKIAEETWDRVIDTNLKGSFLMCREILPSMRQQGWGRIINISSVVGQTGIPGTIAYSASKSGLFGLTRTLAVENVSKGITVNALALGYFEVGMINTLSPENQERIRNQIPMKRFGHPRNVEAAINFLIESDYVTGTVIDINGGLH